MSMLYSNFGIQKVFCIWFSRNCATISREVSETHFHGFPYYGLQFKFTLVDITSSCNFRIVFEKLFQVILNFLQLFKLH